MPQQADLLNKAVVELAKTLSTTAELFGEFTFFEYGVSLPEAVTDAAPVSTAISIAKAAAESLAEASDELAGALQSPNSGNTLGAALRTFDALRVFIQALPDVVDKVEIEVNTFYNAGDPERDKAITFLGEFADHLIQALLARRLAEYSPSTLLFLSVLGLADWRFIPEDPADELSLPYLRMRLHIERIKNLIQDPEDHFKNTLGWGENRNSENAFDPTDFFKIYKEFYPTEADIEIDADPQGNPFLKWGIFKLGRQEAPPNTHGLYLETVLTLSKEFEERLPINDAWGTSIASKFDLSGTFTIEVAPPLDFSLPTPTLTAGGQLDFFVNRNEDARPWNLVETGGLIALSVNDVKAGFGIAANLENTDLKFEPRLFAELSQAKLKIGSEEGDSFLAKIIAGAELEAIFDLSLEFIPSKGLVIRAAGGVEIQIPIHRDLGPLRLDTFYLGLFIKDDGTLDLETSLGLGANLGPLKAVVERMGAKTLTRFSDNAEEEFGSVGSSLTFKPPTGIGLSLDAGIIKGGGYLYIDVDRGEYAGALELTFSEWIALKAIGLISTRMPDGSNGFSLLIIITVEFAGGIQLGFGFTLIGVGGLLGLNRRTSIEPLAASIRTGAIESVMFPQNVIENAPRIISDLRAFFPAEEGTFLIGPMVKIGWGTPTLMSLSMGIIIEVPDPTITILGVLKVVLPDEQAAVLKLQVNFIGRIEFSNKLAWFYAELYDSRVLFITLQGGMGVLINWSDDSNFVVSVGGFHPDFKAPPLPFPEPPRILVNLYNTPVAKVQILGYFAVTSNSVQFGARAEVFFGLSEFKIEGHFGFDALFIFSPFFFSFRLSVRLSVKVFGIGLFTVGFSGKLEGPTPWYIKGKGSISLLFFDINVPFEHTWGEKKNTDLPPIAVLPLLEQELEMTSNWQANLPAGVHTLVSLRQLGDGESDELVLHPVGTLSVSQRKVPLDIELEKFGNQKPSDVKELTVGVAAGLSELGDLKEQFALGHFKDLKEEEKLSKPAFQPMHSGLDLSVDGEQTQTSAAAVRTMRYERILIDGAFRRRIVEAILAFIQLLLALLKLSRRNQVRQSPLSATRKAEMKPQDQAIKLRPDQFTVVMKADNSPAGALQSVTFDNQVMAEDYLAKQKRNNPAQAAALHVIPAVEANIRA